MSIQFNCSHCGLSLTTESRFAGYESQCLRCLKPVAIPGPAEYDLTQPPFNYRSIAIIYPKLQLLWLALWILLFWLLYLLKGLGAGAESALVSLFPGIPLTLMGLIYVGFKSWRIKRILQKGGYSIGLLGTYLGQFRFDCPQCNSPTVTPDRFVAVNMICPFCQAEVIALPRGHGGQVPSIVMQSEQWKYDYRSIIRWDRRMMLSLLLFCSGIFLSVSILSFVFHVYETHGIQGDFFHRSFMLLAMFFLLVSVLSALVYLFSAIKLVGQLHLYIPIFYILIMGISVIGLLLYIPFFLIRIKLHTIFILRESGYTCALWATGMKQFAGHNSIDETDYLLENHRP